MAHYFETLEELGRFTSANRIVVDPGLDLWSFSAVGEEGARYFEQQPELRRVVGFIARQIGSVNLNLYSWAEDGARARLYPSMHAAARFLERPSGDDPRVATTAFNLKESLLLDGLIFNRFCALMEYDERTGLPSSMTRLPASRVKFHGKAGVVDGVTYHREDGKVVEFEDEKLELLFYNVGYTPHTGANGSSPLKALRELLDGSTEAYSYRKDLLTRAARLSGVIEHPSTMSDKAYERLQSSWAEFQRGGSRAGSEPILEEGAKYTQVKPVSVDDVLDLDGRRLSAEEVATMYWIYPELLGLREGTNSNMEALKQALWSICLDPYIEEWKQSWDRMIRTQFRIQNKYVDADLAGKMRGSFKDEAEAITKLVGRPIKTVNEARADRNEPPVEGGDELIVPLNVTEGGQAALNSGE